MLKWAQRSNYSYVYTIYIYISVQQKKSEALLPSEARKKNSAHKLKRACTAYTLYKSKCLDYYSSVSSTNTEAAAAATP